jgi:hypothetical protein
VGRRLRAERGQASGRTAADGGPAEHVALGTSERERTGERVDRRAVRGTAFAALERADRVDAGPRRWANSSWESPLAMRNRRRADPKSSLLALLEAPPLPNSWAMPHSSFGLSFDS